MATIRETIKLLEQQARIHATGLDTPCAAAVWLPEDIWAKPGTPMLTPGDVAEVLHALHDEHDANEGISWKTIAAAVERQQSYII